MSLTYKRPYCNSCCLIWGKPSIGLVLNCNQCGQPLTLKSFNPWLNALIGIAILCRGLATMAIPGFPVFLIGSFLFGLTFMFKGVKQWFKIKKIDGKDEQPSQSELLVPGGILTCRKCGQKNRVTSHSRKRRPICGICQTPLYKSRFAILTRQSRLFRPALIGTFAIFAVIVVAAFTDNARPRSTFPPPNRYDNVEPLHPKPSKDLRFQLNRRLPNGMLIRFGYLAGSGQIEINNGLSYDAIAKLVVPKTQLCVAYFYISAGAVHTLTNIPDGNYRLLFATGEDWDSTKAFFLRPRGVSEFSKRLSFETRRRYEGNYVYDEYTVMKLTLHPVPQGNAKTHNVAMT